MHKIIPGYRIFDCQQCGFVWKEKCRDCESVSQSGCLNCNELTEPDDYIHHPEWPTDKFVNLIEETDEKISD